MTRRGDVHSACFRSTAHVTRVATVPGVVKPLRISESDFQARITTMAEYMGWRWWHVKDSRKQQCGRWVPDGEIAGFPDLTMVHPRHGVVFAEVKGEGGRLTAKQKTALTDIADACTTAVPRGVLVHVWFPDDWDDVIVPVLQGVYDGPRFYGIPA